MAILTKSNQNLPSRTRLLECVIYDPDTGSFTCKIHQYKSKYHPGDILGSKSSNGYLQIYIDGVPYLAHRLAWLYFYGEIPEHDIDHKDTDRLNNKINNLRKATRSQNLQNQSVKPSNTSGFKGVSFNKQKNKYEARIRVNGQRIRLGFYDSAEDAGRAYEEAAKLYHKEFAYGNFS